MRLHGLPLLKKQTTQVQLERGAKRCQPLVHHKTQLVKMQDRWLKLVRTKDFIITSSTISPLAGIGRTIIIRHQALLPTRASRWWPRSVFTESLGRLGVQRGLWFWWATATRRRPSPINSWRHTWLGHVNWGTTANRAAAITTVAIAGAAWYRWATCPASPPSVSANRI